MRTLKVIKVEKESMARNNRNQLNQAADRDVVLQIEFIQHRGWRDFDKLWKAVLKLNKNVDDASNYHYLFNLLTTVISEYHARKQLLYWTDIHDEEGRGLRKYNSVTFEHDIGNLSQQMVKRVAYRLFYDERKVSIGTYLEFQRIVGDFVAAVTYNNMYDVVDIFYSKLIEKYFESHERLHISMAILFGKSYFDGDLLKVRFDS